MGRETLRIADIRRDGGTQLRVGTHEDTILEYAEAMKAGVVFPPVVVFRDADEALWLADGFQRIDAADRCKRKTVDADVREGSVRDAILYACGANIDHGLRRNRDDARRAILQLLQDPEWVQRSDLWISEICRVSPTTVGKYRASLSKLEGAPAATKRKTKDGRVMEITNLGKASPCEPDISKKSPDGSSKNSEHGSESVNKNTQCSTVKDVWDKYPEAREAICQITMVLSANRQELRNLILTVSHLVGPDRERFQWKQPISQRIV